MVTRTFLNVTLYEYVYCLFVEFGPLRGSGLALQLMQHIRLQTACIMLIKMFAGHDNINLQISSEREKPPATVNLFLDCYVCVCVCVCLRVYV